jgi:hypothetical protein
VEMGDVALVVLNDDEFNKIVSTMKFPLNQSFAHTKTETKYMSPGGSNEEISSFYTIRDRLTIR